MNKERIKKNWGIGFSESTERDFLARLPESRRIKSLEQEIKAQIKEDVGEVAFTNKYNLRDGKVIDPTSGESLTEITRRGGVEAEVIAMEFIENSLNKNPDEMVVHFSLKNKDLNYDWNCVDFWRLDEKEVICNRMFFRDIRSEQMKSAYQELSGTEINDEMEILAKPINTKLKLAQVLPFFGSTKINVGSRKEEVDRVVEQVMADFKRDFQDKIGEDKDLIYRIYSAANEYFLIDDNEKPRLDHKFLYKFMYVEIIDKKEIQSFGCFGKTTVGVYGEKIGYYVMSNGSVIFGEIPKGYKECKKCGCWYMGSKCPFC